MSEPAVVGEFLKSLFQAVVIGSGWYVVHRLSANRDRDKARREMVSESADGLLESLDSLLVSARDYHLTERSVPVELTLKMSLQDLGMRLQGLSIVCADAPTLASCRAEVAALRRAITAHHFEDEHLAPLADSDRQIEDIADVLLRAKRQVLRLKFLQFPIHDKP